MSRFVLSSKYGEKKAASKWAVATKGDETCSEERKQNEKVEGRKNKCCTLFLYIQVVKARRDGSNQFQCKADLSQSC